MNDTHFVPQSNSRKADVLGNPDVKPTALPVLPDGIPPALRDLPQWVAWRWEWNEKEQRWKKPPINPHTGRYAKVSDSSTWGTFALALAYHQAHPDSTDGIGFMLTAKDPFAGADLDDGWDREARELRDWARPLVGDLNSYTELSPTGTGVKVIIIGQWPGTGRGQNRKRHGEGEVEVYDRGRYFTLTGQDVPGLPLEPQERQAALERLHAAVWGESTQDGHAGSNHRGGSGGPETLSDEELIRRARDADNGRKFASLWDGDTAGYPSHSEADCALCEMLGWWTGWDRERTDRLFRQSGLYREKKWGKRADYRKATIDRAFANHGEGYQGARGEGVYDTHPGSTASGNGQAQGGPTPSSNGAGGPGVSANGDEQGPAGPGPKERKLSDATRLERLVMDSGAELFHTPDRDPYLRFKVQGHRETWPVRSQACRRWLVGLFRQHERRVPGGQAVHDALLALEGRADFDGPERSVFVRVAPYEGAIYLDLGNATWQAVSIGPDGWKVVASEVVPVRFRRGKGTRPLPTPRPGSSLLALRRFVNVRADADWLLLLGWLVAVLRPRGPYPALVLAGEQGTCKTTLGKVLQRLTDPNAAELRAEPKDVRDLMIAATGSWLVAYDNLSQVPTWLSDALCRMATGGGFGTRALYTNDEEILFNARRPVLLTSIADVVTEPDLLDRSLAIQLEPLGEQQRLTEEAFDLALEEVLPDVLGGLLDTVVAGLRTLPTVQENLPRMADFARWAEACLRGSGLAEPGAFLEAYATNRSQANTTALDASPVAVVLLRAVQGGWTFEGSASDLLTELSQRAGEATCRQDGWPRRANVLSGHLRKIVPNLRRAGVEVTWRREGTGRSRVVSITRQEREGETSSASSASSAGEPTDDQ